MHVVFPTNVFEFTHAAHDYLNCSVCHKTGYENIHTTWLSYEIIGILSLYLKALVVDLTWLVSMLPWLWFLSWFVLSFLICYRQLGGLYYILINKHSIFSFPCLGWFLFCKVVDKPKWLSWLFLKKVYKTPTFHPLLNPSQICLPKVIEGLKTTM